MEWEMRCMGFLRTSFGEGTVRERSVMPQSWQKEPHHSSLPPDLFPIPQCLYPSSRVTKLLMCIRLQTWELRIGEPPQQCRMDVNQRLTGMNASLSTENSALLGRECGFVSVSKGNCRCLEERLPEEVTPSRLRPEERAEVRL